jgi:hypothetical protein
MMTRRIVNEWWGTALPWRALSWHLPIIGVHGDVVTGIVVHEQGQYGWNVGDWVAGEGRQRDYHFGLDIVGWLGDSERSHPLDKRVVCGSPLRGIVDYVQPDEHDHLSVVIRHSSVRAARRRFSFFGDLEEVHVKKGQEVDAGSSLGRPCRLRGTHRFFHFGIGYEVALRGQWRRFYVNPAPSIDGQIEVRTIP